MKEAPGATRVLEGSAGLRILIYRLKVQSPGRPERLLEVRQPVLRVGSHAGNDVVVEDDSVSRIHLEISADERGFRLRDLGSTNGTTLDGLCVLDVYLPGRAVIGLGLTELTFERGSEEAELSLSPRDRFGPMVGQSPPMRRLFAEVEQVAPADCTVLIQGESGTGKELLAEAIHEASPRAGGPFVVFDCSAVAPSLLESELFGHEKGAFTGAALARPGCLEAADGGTLFLDEIGELPLELQPKLLRAVERREVRPLGSSEVRKVDVRILAATHRDLADEVNRGSFRGDLYYRLAVVRLTVPPLRERAGDIPLLVEHLLQRTLGGDTAKVERVLGGIGAATWDRLAKLPWHGNVRELRNFIERRVVFGERAAADAEPGHMASAPAGSQRDLGFTVDLARPFVEQRERLLAEFERTYLSGVLEQAEGNFSRAAAVAQIDRMYFKRLLKRNAR